MPKSQPPKKEKPINLEITEIKKDKTKETQIWKVTPARARQIFNFLTEQGENPILRTNITKINTDGIKIEAELKVYSKE